MKLGEFPKLVFPFLVVSGFLLIPLGCKQRDAQVPATDGQIDFIKVVEEQYRRLTSGEIGKRGGFSNQCSVGMDIKRGIRVSETVCDSSGKFWDVTIRVTDPSSRPPSQRQKTIGVVLDDHGDIILSRGNSQQLSNGVTMSLDRTGQSVVMNGQVNFEP